MFAKVAVFFFALVAFVNAAPIVDYTKNPGVRPIKVALPGGEYKIQPIGDVTLKRELSLDVDTNNDIAIDLLNNALSFGLDTSVDLTLPDPQSHPKRETVDLDALSSKIINGLKSNGLDNYVEHFSTRIQRLKDLLASDVSSPHIATEADNLLLEYRQVLAGLNVNKPVKARDIVISSQVLSQLQSFVDNTVSLLRTLGKNDAVKTFLSEVNRLKSEAKNGTLDAGDLLNAARDIVLSIL